MDFSFITEMYVPVVMAACLVIGYCIKHISWLDRVSNQYIPAILVIVGAVLACINMGNISLNSVVAGAVTGLSSTGLHEMFSSLIDRKNN